LYINDTLRQVSTVPAGPFAIENSPLLSGAGEARIVVRDLLGRETVQVQPFFTDLTLLSQGLSDWSVEVGAPRRNLGTESGNYAEPFFSGGARYGMTSNVTAEGGAQVSGSAQAAGVGATLALPWQSLGQASIAASRGSDNTRGYEWILGASHHRSAHGFSLEAQSASRTYRSLGLDSTVSRARALSASYYYTSEKLGSVAFALARVAGHTGFALTSYSANYSLRVGKRGSLAFNFIRVNGTSSGSSAGVALSLPLGGQTTASVGMNHAAGRTDSYMSANQGLTDEIGFAWRALAGTRSKRTYSEGGVSYQGRRALLTGDISAAGGQQTARVGAQGGLVYVDGRFFSSRRLQDSFALVEVPGYPNIGVGFQGGILTRTDEHGVALLPRLLPYQVNRIRLDAADLPINAELDTIEQTVVPAARSAVKIRFPVRPGRGALIKILLDDGEPAPAGAQINIAGDTKTFFVARRGESFVTGLQGKNTLRMAWKRRFCTFSVDLPAGKVDDIARVGPVTCAGIGR
jgi:outer membrane usher protein